MWAVVFSEVEEEWERDGTNSSAYIWAVYQLVHFQELGTMLVTKFSESGAEPFREPWLNINMPKSNALSIWFVTWLYFAERRLTRWRGAMLWSSASPPRKEFKSFFSSPTVSDERKQKSEAISSIWNVRVFLQRSEMMPSGGQQLRLRQAFYHFLHPVTINLFVVRPRSIDSRFKPRGHGFESQSAD